MNPDWIFLPVLVQILLVVVLYFYLAVAKAQAAKAGLVDENRRALHADAWPDHVIQINNCIRNQFEAPVLFYILVLILWALEAVTVFTFSLCALFVMSRLAHAYVHTGSNYVPMRRRFFLTGTFLLLLLWGCVLKALI